MISSFLLIIGFLIICHASVEPPLVPVSDLAQMKTVTSIMTAMISRNTNASIFALSGKGTSATNIPVAVPPSGFKFDVKLPRTRTGSDYGSLTVTLGKIAPKSQTFKFFATRDPNIFEVLHGENFFGSTRTNIITFEIFPNGTCTSHPRMPNSVNAEFGIFEDRFDGIRQIVYITLAWEKLNLPFTVMFSQEVKFLTELKTTTTTLPPTSDATSTAAIETTTRYDPDTLRPIYVVVMSSILLCLLLLTIICITVAVRCYQLRHRPGKWYNVRARLGLRGLKKMPPKKKPPIPTAPRAALKRPMIVTKAKARISASVENTKGSTEPSMESLQTRSSAEPSKTVSKEPVYIEPLFASEKKIDSLKSITAKSSSVKKSQGPTKNVSYNGFDILVPESTQETKNEMKRDGNGKHMK